MRSFFLTILLLSAAARAEISVEIDLSAQAAFLLENGRVISETPIASGRASHPTPAGNFAVIEKELNHHSNLYGRVVDADGSVVVRDADAGTPVPEGGTFVQAPMPHFMRFNGAIGMHAGRLPGYAASHGCVRLPAEMATHFYRAVHIGTPVRVIGKAPAGHVARHRTTTEPTVVAPAPAPPRHWFPWFWKPAPAPQTRDPRIR